ncbi:MAG: HepT-like ribonuclease domain-containing protein [Candidatus Bathyarchaeia archaeon]
MRSEAGIIPKDFAEIIASMIGFRKLLVRDYASIDLDMVYEFLQTKLLKHS